ncbi:peptidase C39 family protein [Streptomyces sp. NBC_01261]|uniref:peptidase C39 family protein n=1 Tax=Streptomyces sp. NBC_01261 TaxID=2903802 RepID=UPI002E362E70|nr:peptidase C39 family protein [Streptomyces sp. NBC_01261]
MPSSQQEARAERTVVPFEPGALPRPLWRLGHHEVLERWQSVDRSAHGAHIVAVGDDEDGDGANWIGAALVTARPHTAYLKIVDAVGDIPATVAAVVDHARDRALVQVKWEGWTARPEDAAAAGFTLLRPPLVEGAEDEVGPASGYVRWLHAGAEVTEPPYYRQTTHFSCGAVTALVAQAHAGLGSAESLDRRAELTLWRDATNFPSCEPVGLGVAVRRAWPSSSVVVHLDVDRPVLLDNFPETEKEWRADLQSMSRTDAIRIGVPIVQHPLPPAGIRSAIGRGERVLLLISLAGMHGFEVPHWVLCHGTVPGAVVIEDPWAAAATGDTWVDAHLLPVPDESLDTMSDVAPDGFHGAVLIGDTPRGGPGSPTEPVDGDDEE